MSIPEDLAPDELTSEKVQELLEAPSSDRELGTDPESGHPVVVKAGRYGPYVTTVVPEGSKDAPRTASLFASMTPETLTLEQALTLLTLPRTVGTAPDGEEIQALNGRYGPYLKKGTDSRSLDSEDKLFSTTLEEALAIFAQPKQRGRRAAAEPLKELGPDPVTEGQVTVREGRFGPYVTDGETNASLRKGDDVETITIERAAELLADRRARGPATKKKAAKKTTAKKTAAKKAPGEEGRGEDGGGHGGCGAPAPPAERDDGRLGDAELRARALSFGSVAAEYAALRPGYPADAVAFLAGDEPRRVLDLGAGTGLLTDVLVGGRPRRGRGRSRAGDARPAGRAACRRSRRPSGRRRRSRSPTPRSTRSSPARPPTGSTRNRPPARSAGCCGPEGPSG